MKKLLAILAVLVLASFAGMGTASAIVGGSPDTVDRPWMGSLQQKSNGAHGCGTSLIASRWAVTAYHCVSQWMNNPAQVQVRFNTMDRTTGGTLVGVESVHVPQGANVVGNDIALLKLDAPVNLPVAKLADVSPAIGSNVTMIGWGLTCAQSLPGIFYCGEPPVARQTTTVKLNPDWQCLSIGTGIVGDRELCVGSYFEGKAACYGDSGGPSIVGDRLVGVTSRQPHVFLYGNCYIAPAIYTDVAPHRDWIRSLTGV